MWALAVPVYRATGGCCSLQTLLLVEVEMTDNGPTSQDLIVA